MFVERNYYNKSVTKCCDSIVVDVRVERFKHDVFSIHRVSTDRFLFYRFLSVKFRKRKKKKQIRNHLTVSISFSTSSHSSQHGGSIRELFIEFFNFSFPLVDFIRRFTIVMPADRRRNTQRRSIKTGAVVRGHGQSLHRGLRGHGQTRERHQRRFHQRYRKRYVVVCRTGFETGIGFCLRKRAKRCVLKEKKKKERKKPNLISILK